MLVCPTAFHRERVRSRFGERIRCLAEEIAGHPLPVSIELAAGETRPSPPATVPLPARHAPPGQPAPAPPAASVAARSTQLILPSTFDTFVTGPANALSREASFALARTPQLAFFPLFLAGESGTGKSHLARAVVAEARRRGVERSIYVSAERFTTDFTGAIRGRQGSAKHQGCPKPGRPGHEFRFDR